MSESVDIKVVWRGRHDADLVIAGLRVPYVISVDVADSVMTIAQSPFGGVPSVEYVPIDGSVIEGGVRVVRYAVEFVSMAANATTDIEVTFVAPTEHETVPTVQAMQADFSAQKCDVRSEKKQNAHQLKNFKVSQYSPHTPHSTAQRLAP